MQETSKAGGISPNGAALRRQMQLRGLTAAELAGLAELSPATVSNALAGRGLHPHTYRALAEALTKAPIVPGVELLAGAEELDSGERRPSAGLAAVEEAA